ncbi:hypothetical protein PROQFM164_S01g001087 [Penicillium roqueforti FM164]|uniref:Uncharacterized protein n=1 Tax=Penicillium roqueforti (strain FM164) TaxID=1365484 RepID=W6PSX1_PENRF|nr:hypothetical protein PROQFM164_S01g001087 [Penicillium roqueforti FM164]
MSLIQLKTITALYPLTLSALGDFFTTSIQRPRDGIADTQHGRSQSLPQEPRSRYHDEHSGEEPLRGSVQLKI